MQKENSEFNLYYYLDRNEIDRNLVVKRNFKKNETVAKCEDHGEDVFFIEDGNCRVEIVTNKGKKLVVDEVSSYNFTGHLSNRRGQNFYCDIVAATRCVVVLIPHYIMDRLMQDTEFAMHYYEMTSERIYIMTKRSLINQTFSQYEIIALYVYQNLKGDRFEPMVSIYQYCSINNISRRNMYNIFEVFEKDGIWKKEIVGKKNEYHILNKEKLEEVTRTIRNFMCNTYL